MGSIGAYPDQTQTPLIPVLGTKSTNAFQKVTRNELKIIEDSSMHQTNMPHARPGAIWRSFPDFLPTNHPESIPRYCKRKKSQDQDACQDSMTVNPKKKMTEKRYRRHAKPPYSYVGLIALAIQSSPTKQLKLSEILAHISTMFPFFKGEYQGWRDSVRHNLSQNKCFKKVLPDPKRPQSKGNFWTVNIDEIPAEKLKRQNTPVARNVAPGFTYARFVGQLRVTRDKNNMKTISAICGGSFSQNSPDSCTSDDLETLLDAPNLHGNTSIKRLPNSENGYNNPVQATTYPVITPDFIPNHREMSPESLNSFGVSSPITSTSSNSAPHTPSSVHSDIQSGLLHYNNGCQITRKLSPHYNRNRQSGEEKVEDESPPPNIAPFGETKRSKPDQRDGRPTPPSTPETTNIDYSFGPIGPPNVNLTSCDDLAKLPASKRNSEILDQYNFIKEQSEILGGRNSSSNNNTIVDLNNNTTTPPTSAYDKCNPANRGHFLTPNFNSPHCYASYKPNPQDYNNGHFYYNFLPSPTAPIMFPSQPLTSTNPFLPPHLLNTSSHSLQKNSFYS